MEYKDPEKVKETMASTTTHIDDGHLEHAQRLMSEVPLIGQC